MFSLIFECFLKLFFGSVFGRLLDTIFKGFGEDFGCCFCCFFESLSVLLAVAKISENRALASRGPSFVGSAFLKKPEKSTKSCPNVDLFLRRGGHRCF